MPPQPIDKVKRDAAFQLTLDGSSGLGPITQAAMECVAKWALVEVALGILFLEMLKANEIQGANLFSSLGTANAKAAAIRSLAVSALNKEEHKLFSALLRYIKSQQRIRDKLCHWIIGYSDQIPQALVLVDPKDVWPLIGSTKERFRFHNVYPDDFKADRIKRNLVFIYRIQDAQSDKQAFIELADLIDKFISFVNCDIESCERNSLFCELNLDVRLETS